MPFNGDQLNLKHAGLIIAGLLLSLALIIARAEPESTASEDAIERLNQTADSLYQQGQYDRAINIAQKALLIAEENFGRDHTETATSLNNLAVLNKAQGRYSEAEPLHQRALAIREKALGPEHPDVAQSLNNLAALYDAQGRYSEAAPLYRRALTIREQVFGPEHPSVASSFSNLAGLYDAQGRYNEVEPLYQRALAINEKASGSEHPDVATSLNNLAVFYSAQGRYDEAESLFQRALAISEQSLGREHPETATSLNNLAAIYHHQSRYAKAEPFYRRALDIREQALGPAHPDVALSLSNLAVLYFDQGRFAEAEPLHQRALAIREQALGPEHPDVALSLSNLAALYDAQGRNSEAAPLYRRALTIREQVLSPNHPDVASSVNNLAVFYSAQGRYAEAESLFQRALDIREQALGPEHPDVAISLNNLAGLYVDQGRYGAAEPLYQRALAILEQALGLEHPDVASRLNSLALLYSYQGRNAEAEPLCQRALAIREQALGSEHPDVAASLSNLAGLYDAQGRYGEAELLYQRSLAINEQALGPDHPDLAHPFNNLATLYFDQGRFAEAEPLHQRALAIRKQALGSEHPDVALSLNNLAILYEAQGRFAEAEPLYQSALAIWEKVLYGKHPDVATCLNNLARLFRNQGRVNEALPLHHCAQAIDAERLRRGLTGKTGEGNTDQRDRALTYLLLLAELNTLTAQDQTDRLLAIQLARRADIAEAFQSLAQRLAAGGRGELADLVRQRQDVIVKLQVAEKRLLDSYSLPAEERSEELIKNLRAQIDRLGEQERDLSERLQRDFPAYTEFEGTQLTDLATLQQALKPKEAAIAWVLGEDHAYRLIVRSEDDPSLQAVSVSAEDIGASIQQLHQALDLADDSHYGSLADFPAATAYRLFTQLFGADWATVLADIDHLLLVPEGALTRLPFAALLTAKPQNDTFAANGEDYQDAPWLAERFALSILPSLSAILSLRVHAAASPADRPFLGIGDPLLKDHPAKMRGGQAPQSEQLALVRNIRGLEQVQEIASTEDLRHIRLDRIRQLSSLPDSANELEAIAKLFDAKPALLLREAATESALKQSPLDDYRIVSFATHGVLAGELGRGIEPGLILTPPQEASDQDDGFLSLSEVAQLKLNSDWVVLSACNTAGGAEREAEGMTGLAKAFIYAGTKSLLVSHWAVSSQGTVALMSRLFKQYQDQRIPRAQAHRLAMRQMIASGNPLLSHPSLWAPFVVVGDGG